MMQKNKKWSLLLLFCGGVLFSTAQQYHYRAPLNKVIKTGFYQIPITPQLSAKLKTDFTDLRVVDAADKWIPHIIKTTLPFFQENYFNEFPILKNEVTDSGKSILIIENKGAKIYVPEISQKNISEIILFIKNSSASRYASLSGSNDKVHWFIVNDHILLTNNYEQTKESYFINSISFNITDYPYFKLTIDNEHADPLNIIKTGSYSNLTFQSLNYKIKNPIPTITQKDSSDGKSYIKIINEDAFQIDGISIEANGSKFFNRTANLYLPQSDSLQNKINYNSKAVFSISSTSSNSFGIQKIKAKVFYIVIENKDNPPLKITSIQTEQSINNIITYLEKDKPYYLLADNELATKPNYDLEQFKDSIPAQLDTLGFGGFIKIEKEIVAQKNTNNKWWLWPAIIAAIGMLGFLTFKLLGDMKTKEV